MKLIKSSRPTVKGPKEWFTGDAYIELLRDSDEQSKIGCYHVRFVPGARTAWHTHPKGQTLYITDGVGCVCRRGGKIEIIKPGDVVFFEPNEEHWHGAMPDRLMAHVAIQEADEMGAQVTWLDHVNDDEYLAK